MATDRNGDKPVWHMRRRIIITSLILCAFVIIYITIWGEDTRLNETIILGAFGLTASVIGAYCFSAVWDDNNSKIHSTRDDAESPRPRARS